MTGADPAFEACNDAQVEVLVAERDELLAEVARLTDDLRVEQSVTHQCEAIDAAIERVRKLADELEMGDAAMRALGGGRLDSLPTTHVVRTIRQALDGEVDRA